MRRVTARDFSDLVGLVRRHQVAAVKDAHDCASGADCPSCFAVRMRFASVAAYVVRTQHELDAGADTGDVPDRP